jgi:hypothetical protein
MGGYWVYNANKYVKRSKYFATRPSWRHRLLAFLAFAATWSETDK